jgi:hypothetical protein
MGAVYNFRFATRPGASSSSVSAASVREAAIVSYLEEIGIGESGFAGYGTRLF